MTEKLESITGFEGVCENGGYELDGYVIYCTSPTTTKAQIAMRDELTTLEIRELQLEMIQVRGKDH